MQGIGLGLVICKMIVEKCHGQINFVSNYNKQTTFFFTFESHQYDIDEKCSRFNSINRMIRTKTYVQSIVSVQNDCDPLPMSFEDIYKAIKF